MSPVLGNSQIFDKAYAIFENYNPDTMVQYLDASVDLTIDDDYEFVNRKKAAGKIAEFIQSHGSIRMIKKHNGSSKNQSSNYRVATMNTIIGDYRVYLYSELNGSKQLIKEIRLDKL